MIQFEQITKSFPGVAALSDVSFDVQTGECHALLGENGAGKSTLGKILAGMYRPDGGRILIDGHPVNFHSCRDAARAGVAIVHQELVFCPNLSVAENLCLHDLPRHGPFLDRGRLRRQAKELLAQVGLDVDVERPLASLSIAQEQLVQIAAAVGQGAKIVVFDEPTSSLGRGEVDRLFALIRRLKQSGVTIIYVSHRLEEIFELCETVTVLRDGRRIDTRPIVEINHDELVRLMVGRDIETAAPAHTAGASSEIRLQVRRFSSRGRFTDFSLELRAGEIVGLGGLVGAGRSEVLEALYGLDRHAVGEIVIAGRSKGRRSSHQTQRLGMTLVPEDRKRQGLVLGMNVRENLTLPILDRFRRALGWVNRRSETTLAGKYRSELSIRAASIETPVTSLSGGNQQKIVFARGMDANCRILLVDEPTRGVDVGAKREIHDLLRQLAAQGTAVLLVSSDLPELLILSDRIIVLRLGKIVSELTREQATPDVVLRAMAGLRNPN